MKPELRPPSTVRNGGSPSERPGLTIRSSLRSEIDASSATAIAMASRANASGWPWKFPFETTIRLLHQHEWVVGGGVELDLHRPLGVVQQVAAGPVHLRCTAQRVRVLDLVAPAVGLDDRGPLQEQPDVGRGVSLALAAAGRRGWVR